MLCSICDERERVRTFSQLNSISMDGWKESVQCALGGVMEDTPDHGFRTQNEEDEDGRQKIDVCYIKACFSLGMLAFSVGM